MNFLITFTNDIASELSAFVRLHRSKKKDESAPFKFLLETFLQPSFFKYISGINFDFVFKLLLLKISPSNKVRNVSCYVP